VTSIVFATHSQQQCGVHQFGRQIFKALQGSSKYEFVYCEVNGPSELREAIFEHNASAVIVNFHPATIGWAAGRPVWFLQIPSIGIMHEMTDALADQTDDALFDYYIFHDPSAETRNPLFFTSGRLIHPTSRSVAAPTRVTVGSFGFATAGKGFEAVAARAHAEFDDCLIRFNIPSSEFCDKDGSQARIVADRCRSIITKPGVQIEVTHDFMDLDGVENFLAGNSINAFFYDEQDGRGISSATDLALSARRPIAARRTSMVRHMFGAQPSIFIEERSLREIAESGVAPLQPFIDRWTADNVRLDYEKMLDTVFSRETPQLARSRWYKRVAEIDDRDRVGSEMAASARRAEAAATERVQGLERALADLERKLLVDLRSDLEGNSRSLRLGLATARLSRRGSRLIRTLLGPRLFRILKNVWRS
jgi:hypothetical protein